MENRLLGSVVWLGAGAKEVGMGNPAEKRPPPSQG